MPNIRAIYLDEDDQEKPKQEKTPIRLRYIDEEPEESLGTSLIKAPGKIYEDVTHGAMNTIKKIPEYYEKAKTEVPGYFNTVTKHPLHAAQQANAGLAELIFNTANLPHDIANYSSNRLNLLPKSVPEILEKHGYHFKPEEVQQSVNQMFGKPEYPGEEMIRGGFRNLDIALPGIGAINKFNPLKLTNKNIVKDVLNARNKNYEKYTGKNGLYNQLEDKATQRGVDLSNIDFRKINNDLIDLSSMDKLKTNPSITNAQRAISDLGHSERILDRKKKGTGLSDAEKDRLKNIKETKNYIQENMFKDKSGKLHEDLLNEHKKIQQGYAKEVIPYTKNKAINEYLKGEKLEDQLVKSLQSGKFPAQSGHAHKPLMIRRSTDKHPYLTGGGLGSLGLLLYERLMGKNNESRG